MPVFGIPIEGGDIREVRAGFEKSSGRFWIVTVNPEILLEARKKPSYAETLRVADYRMIDGFGLFLFNKYVLRRKCSRVTGVALSEWLLEEASRRGWRVGILGGGKAYPDSVEKAEAYIKRKFPRLDVSAEQVGEMSELGEDGGQGGAMRARMQTFDPEVLLVGFGHPKQERWIERYAHAFSHLKVIVGVGGTLDFWAGNVKRAPGWMRHIGLEWLWRLLQEPKRFKRIVRAVCLFPVLAVVDMFRVK